MEALGLTWFDAAALAIIVFSGIMGLARGLIREVFTIVGVVAAVVAAYYFAGPVAPLAQQMLGLEPIWATLVGGFAVFLVVFIVITFLTMVIARSVHRSTEIGSVDRAAGLAFGVARGVLIIGLLIALITQGRPSSDAAAAPEGSARAGFELPREITEAKLYPIFAATAGVLRSILPKIVDESRTLIEENREGAQNAARDLANDALERQKAREAQAAQQQPAQQPAQQPKQ